MSSWKCPMSSAGSLGFTRSTGRLFCSNNLRPGKVGCCPVPSSRAQCCPWYFLSPLGCLTVPPRWNSPNLDGSLWALIPISTPQDTFWPLILCVGSPLAQGALGLMLLGSEFLPVTWPASKRAGLWADHFCQPVQYFFHDIVFSRRCWHPDLRWFIYNGHRRCSE